MAVENDTITAIATSTGRGGIAIIRVSGPSSQNIAKSLGGVTPEPRKANYCVFKDADGEIVDKGILILFLQPASYTGEDMLELHCHGGSVVSRLLLKRVIELGARHARPGEFSERAFLNGKIDLIQAEAIADLIDSHSERAARSAMRSLEGVFSAKVGLLLEKLIGIRIYVEGALDFPEEEIDFLEEGKISDSIRQCLDELDALLKTAKQGRVLREGLNLVIIGRPNAGKSSLLNQLVQAERAIVTEMPGTTRDLIEEQIQINGIAVTIVDTAGIRETEDAVEQEGVKRTYSAIETADIILQVRDCAATADDNSVAEEGFVDKMVIIVNNKIDLMNLRPEARRDIQGRVVVNVSAKTGEGMVLLMEQLQRLFVEETSGEDIILARARHIDALEETRRLIREGQEKYRRHKSSELLAEELRHAQESLGKITGNFVTDDLLGEIFSRFCIGK